MNRSNKAGAILKSVDGLNESDALETVAAFLGLFKNTAAGPKLLQLLILLKH